MNRNTELHFGRTPQIELKRSKFDMSHSHKLTFNCSDLVPVYVDTDILPGDTVQLDMAELVRMMTPIYPIMDNLFMDIYAFFTPHRLVWDNWQAFWGENEDPWTQQTEYEVPYITAPAEGWKEGTIADYMGIPTKVPRIQPDALAFRAYCKIWNDWFRDENLKKCAHIYTDETNRQGMNGDEEGYDYVTGAELGGKPLKVAKFHDYYTSCLPQPQKGDPVSIPLGTTARVNTSTTRLGSLANPMMMDFYQNTAEVGEPVLSRTSTGGIIPGNQSYTLNSLDYYRAAQDPTTQSASTNDLGLAAGVVSNRKDLDHQEWVSQYESYMVPNNLYADLSEATRVTINQLRTAFAIQKYYENAGLHGTRYIEYLRGVFGVTSSDARLQRAEYLGGQRVPINIDQILQTSSTNEVSPQGNTSGFSCTINRDSMFTKSFEEHGTLMVLVCIRTDHTYQQGLEKMWTRRKWTDFYNPFFANLGEDAVLNENIYAQGTAVDKEAFGYQERWAEYRYKNNHVSGYMRSNATGSLDVWHFADDYDSLPHLSSEWIDETVSNVDRTIAVTSALNHQFLGDFYFKLAYTRAMPVYSVPGLIDHV